MSSSDDKDVKGSTEAPVNQTEPSEGHITKSAESEQYATWNLQIADDNNRGGSEGGKRASTLKDSLEDSLEELFGEDRDSVHQMIWNISLIPMSLC